jgi:hypothetical protein
VIAGRRNPAVPAATLALGGAGAALLALAAAGPTWLRPAGKPVAVLVDLSPSTRGAAYRDTAFLNRRLDELLGGRPRDLRFFADGAASIGPATPRLPDLPAERTTMPEAADASAVVLFSDGRLMAVPALLPPVHAVIDPALEQARDAAVTSLDVNADGVASVGVRNTDAPRPMSYRGAAGEAAAVEVATGSFTLTARAAAGAPELSAGFAPGDAWPENDTLRAYAPPPPRAERWWVASGGGGGGGGPPAAGWRAFAPDALPTDPAAYLAAGVVALDNVPAGALDEPRRLALLRYVRDLGGGLLVLGGDRAFAAGGYAGTPLDALSPLASTPPEPTTHWLLLADASGSMNRPAGAGSGAGLGVGVGADAGARTRWDYAAGAAVGAVGQLPPGDLLSVGSFAGAVRWWSRGRTAAETLAMTLPPPDAGPRGATNLDAALRQVAAEAAADRLPSHLLVATDAQADVRSPAELAGRLKAANVRVHVLFIGDPADAAALPALRTLAGATGGTVVAESLPERWAAGLAELARTAQPDHVRREPVRVRFRGALESIPAADVPLWNRTWPKERSEPVAEAEVAGAAATMAARWNVGEGRVLSAAFSPPPALAEALAADVQRPPRDPRFTVTWTAGPTLRVAVDAVEGPTYLNGESLSLELVDRSGSASVAPSPTRAAPVARHIPQVAPGRYELTLAAPREPVVARVRRRGSSLATFAVAGRYATEFDAVGDERAALAALARRTGGTVVEPGVTRPLDLPRPRTPVPLLSWVATAGAALVAAGLVRWRVGS